MSSSQQRACMSCAAKESDSSQPLLRCSRCKQAYFCNRSCQKESWPIHKQYCKQLVSDEYVLDYGSAVEEWTKHFLFPKLPEEFGQELSKGHASPAAAPGGSILGASIRGGAGGTKMQPFQVTTKQDGGTSITMQSISAMPAYQAKSFEELRLEDYSQGNRGSPSLRIPGCGAQERPRSNEAQMDAMACLLAFFQSVAPVRYALRGTPAGKEIARLLQSPRLDTNTAEKLMASDGFPNGDYGEARVLIMFACSLMDDFFTKEVEAIPLDCPVCFDPVHSSDRIGRTEEALLPCGHALHMKCLKLLRNSSVRQNCPTCHDPIPTMSTTVNVRVPDQLSGGSFQFSLTGQDGFLRFYQIDRKSHWKAGDTVAISLSTSDYVSVDKLQPRPLSLNEVLAQKLRRRQMTGFKDRNSLVSILSTAQCGVCESGSTFGGVEEGHIHAYLDRPGKAPVHLEDIIMTSQGCAVCNFCKQTLSSGGKNSNWFFNCKSECWIRKNDNDLPTAPKAKRHLLSLPPVLVVECGRARFDVDNGKFCHSSRAITFKVSNFDLAPFLAMPAPPSATTLYDLRFILRLEPVTSEGEEAVSKHLEWADGARYMGSAKGEDSLWYDFDVCNYTRRATEMDSADHLSSQTAVMLVYVRKDCLAYNEDTQDRAFQQNTAVADGSDDVGTQNNIVGIDQENENNKIGVNQEVSERNYEGEAKADSAGTSYAVKAIAAIVVAVIVKYLLDRE